MNAAVIILISVILCSVSCVAAVVDRYKTAIAIRRQQSSFGCHNACPTQYGYQQVGCCTAGSSCPSGSTCVQSACCMPSAAAATGNFPGAIGNVGLESSNLPSSPCGSCPAGYVQTGCCAYGCSGISVCILNACCALQTQLPSAGQVSGVISGRSGITSTIGICPSGVATTLPCGASQTCTITGQICINNFCCPIMAAGSLGAVCPNGAPSVTTCTNGVCPLNQICISNYCCPNTGVGSTTSSICPDGQVSSTPCVSGLCTMTGYTCQNNFCCQSTPSSGMCPSGAISTTPCINGACLIGTQMCLSNFCCDSMTTQ